MTDLSRIKGPTGQKVKAEKDPAYLARVRELPCCICYEYGLPQMSPTAAHHCINGRFSSRKVPDRQAIPVCEGHHQGNFDKTKIAIHREPEEWQRQYGADTRWISWTENRLGND